MSEANCFRDTVKELTNEMLYLLAAYLLTKLAEPRA